MDKQQLLSTGAQVQHQHQHYATAPMRVRVGMSTSALVSPRFDECTPAVVLSHSRVKDEQYRATVHGLNLALRSSRWRAYLVVSVLFLAALFFGVVVVLPAITDSLEDAWMFVCGILLLLVSGISTLVCLVGYGLEVKQRCSDYLKEANRFYIPLGVYLSFETQLRPARSWLVIDIDNTPQHQQQQPYDACTITATTSASPQEQQYVPFMTTPTYASQTYVNNPCTVEVQQPPALVATAYLQAAYHSNHTTKTAAAGSDDNV